MPVASASSRTRCCAGERLTYDDGVALYDDRRPGLARRASPTTCAPQKNGDARLLQRQPAPQPDQRLRRVVRVLLLPAQAGRDGRVHDAHRGGRPARQGDGARAASPSCTSSTACTRRCRGATTRASLRELKEALPDVALKAFTATEIHWFEKISGLSADEILDELIDAGLESLTGGGAEIFDWEVRAADRRPRHPLGGLVAHPPARALQGPARRPSHDALRPHRGAAAPRRPRAAAARAAGRDRRLRQSSSRCATSTTRPATRATGCRTAADGDRRRGAEDVRGLAAAVRQHPRTSSASGSCTA